MSKGKWEIPGLPPGQPPRGGRKYLGDRRVVKIRIPIKEAELLQQAADRLGETLPDHILALIAWTMADPAYRKMAAELDSLLE